MRAAGIVACCWVACACLLVAGAARADEGSAAFDAAIAREGEDDFSGAADALERFAATHPEHALAADALVEAATLRDGRLHDPARALADWQTIATRYAGRRGADRAATRARELTAALAVSDAATLASFAKMIDDAGAHPTLAQRDTIRAFLDAHPGFPLAGAGHAQLGRAAQQANALDEALREYDAALASPGAPNALVGSERATLLLRRGRLNEAAAAFDALSRMNDPIAREAASSGLLAIAAAKRYTRIAIIALLLLTLLFTVGFVRARGALWPPAIEARFFAPIAALFAIAVLGIHRSIAGAVGIIAAGATTALWIGGAARERSSTITSRLLTAIATTAAIVTIVYLALYATSMLDLVAETMRAGPDA